LLLDPGVDDLPIEHAFFHALLLLVVAVELAGVALDYVFLDTGLLGDYVEGSPIWRRFEILPLDLLCYIHIRRWVLQPDSVHAAPLEGARRGALLLARLRLVSRPR